MRHFSVVVVATFLLSGCGSDGSGDDGGSATGGAATTGGAGTTGGAQAMGGNTGTGGTPLRPPNPRPDIGQPDGTHCSGNAGPALDCSQAQQCCPAGIADTASECTTPGTICKNCTEGDCGAALCDGPEDCPGQLCCFSSVLCTKVGAPCISGYGTARCADRCENASGGEVVVCRDARDCLTTTERCVKQNYLPYISHCTR